MPYWLFFPSTAVTTTVFVETFDLEWDDAIPTPEPTFNPPADYDETFESGWDGT